MKPASLVLCALAALAALGCGPEFDPSNELTTLRVLGLKKDKPYAQPGETVNLQLLWHDAKSDPARPRDVQRVFIDGCVNPPGDLYYGCFTQFAEGAAEGNFPRVERNQDSIDVALPSDILSSRRGSLEPGQSLYGLDIVFFAVCAGRLELAMGDAASTGLPIRCLDAEGEPLGSEDFVFGYTSIYSFEDATNENPDFTVDASGAAQFLVAGRPVTADCVGAACQGAAPIEVDCDAEPERCIAACAEDGDAACPKIAVAPLLSEDVVELDSVSSRLFGNNVTEQMWVNYYVDRGGMSEVRLLNDATTGWNDDYRGELRAPKDPGPLQVWAVSHDNRGGMDFARVTLGVRAE